MPPKIDPKILHTGPLKMYVYIESPSVSLHLFVYILEHFQFASVFPNGVMPPGNALAVLRQNVRCMGTTVPIQHFHFRYYTNISALNIG